MARRKQSEKDAENAANEIAEAIVKISEGMEALVNSKLKQEAIEILVQHACGGPNRITRATIREVLYETINLKKKYLKN